MTILNQNKLMESNFIDWKRTLDIVLTASGCRHVITIPSPLEPEPDVLQYVKDAYTKWTKDNEMARCFIQASMSSVLQHQHQSYKSAYDIISNLKEMFADQVRPARQAVMKMLINTKMAEGTP
ncbi:retrotransposon gag domain-containing protein, partial [Streptomyces plicatus]|uniref:retrotransposon gag domain-containing protein n=1 Tax=Streptomyces plicatus TaxID=1922 RepID=UPI001C6FF74F